jgi:hypothetical protein
MWTLRTILLCRLQYSGQFHTLLLYKGLPQEAISGGFPRYRQLHFLSYCRKKGKKFKMQIINFMLILTETFEITWQSDKMSNSTVFLTIYPDTHLTTSAKYGTSSSKFLWSKGFIMASYRQNKEANADSTPASRSKGFHLSLWTLPHHLVITQYW